MPWLSARVLVEANVCVRDTHTPKCSTLAWPGRRAHYVSECELASCVEGVREEIRNGRFTVEDVVDWLGSTSATSQPLQQLAVIAALHADLEASEPAAGLDPPEARMLSLLGSKLEALQNQRVQLKYYTFLSRAERSCVGFRARDEVHCRRCAAHSQLAGTDPSGRLSEQWLFPHVVQREPPQPRIRPGPRDLARALARRRQRDPPHRHRRRPVSSAQEGGEGGGDAGVCHATREQRGNPYSRLHSRTFVIGLVCPPPLIALTCTHFPVQLPTLALCSLCACSRCWPLATVCPDPCMTPVYPVSPTPPPGLRLCSILPYMYRSGVDVAWRAWHRYHSCECGDPARGDWVQ